MAGFCAGLAFHHAALEPADRSTVEALFKDRKIAVLCTTSTLAVGVNLPAHLASPRLQAVSVCKSCGCAADARLTDAVLGIIVCIIACKAVVP